MQGGGPEKRGCRCWKSLLLHPTGGKERGIRGSEKGKGWRELKKVQVEEKEEKAISAVNWKAVIITEESREEERGWIRAVMGNTSEERRNVEAQLQAESWSAGYHCTLPDSLAHFFLSHIHVSLSLRLTENSPWLSSASGPAPFRRQLGHDWMIQPSTALQVRDDINPPHTHIHTPIWPKQHCSPFPLSVCRSPSRLPVIQQCFTYSYLHGNINAAVYCAIIRPYS